MGDQNDIGILIASDQPAIRTGLKMLLNEENGLCVIAEAHDGHELFKKIESTCPDLVLLDWEMLDRSTPPIIKTICALDQKTLLVVLGTEPTHQQKALEAGADAFVNVSNPPEELLLTINQIFVR